MVTNNELTMTTLFSVMNVTFILKEHQTDKIFVIGHQPNLSSSRKNLFTHEKYQFGVQCTKRQHNVWLIFLRKPQYHGMTNNKQGHLLEHVERNFS